MLQKRKIMIILSILIICIIFNCEGQKIKSYNCTKCEAIKSFLNSSKVIDRFKNLNLSDSLLFIVDIDKGLVKCQMNRWRNLPLIVITNGPLMDSLKKFNSHYVVGERSNIYILRSNKIYASTLSFYILNGASNLDSLVEVKVKNKHFYLGKIENGVQ
jgi:hypothetical protein